MYARMADKAERHGGFSLSLTLLLNVYGLFRRVDGRLSEQAKRLGRVAFIDAEYCLDAPQDIPAGGCRFDVIDLGVDEVELYQYAVQLTTSRED